MGSFFLLLLLFPFSFSSTFDALNTLIKTLNNFSDVNSPFFFNIHHSALRARMRVLRPEPRHPGRRRRRRRGRGTKREGILSSSSSSFFFFFILFLVSGTVTVVVSASASSDDGRESTPGEALTTADGKEGNEDGLHHHHRGFVVATSSTTTRRMLRQESSFDLLLQAGGKEERRSVGGAFDLEEDVHERMRRERREREVQRSFRGGENGLEAERGVRDQELKEEIQRHGLDSRSRLHRHLRRRQQHMLRNREVERRDDERSPVGSGGGNIAEARAAPSSFPPPREVEETVEVMVKEHPVLNPDNDRCVHGYPSSRDGHECICNTDWAGAKCDENPTPSCNRFTFGACGDLLTKPSFVRKRSTVEVKEFPSCKCVDECIDYMLTEFGKETYEVMARENRRFPMNLTTEHFCRVRDGDSGNRDSDINISVLDRRQEREEYRRSYIFEYDKATRQAMREKAGNVNARTHEDKVMFDRTRARIVAIEDHGNEYENSHVQNQGICSPLCEKNGKCEWFECACNQGRFGYECALSEEDILQAKKNSEERYAKNELSLAVADLPGSIKRFLRGHKYKNNGSYRGVHYFFETLIADTGVVDPNGAESLQSTLVVPFFPGDLVGNVGGFTTLMERVIEYADKTYSLKEAVHPTVWINAMDRSLCTVQEDLHSELPPGAIVVSQFGMWRVNEGKNECFNPDRDIVIPSSLSTASGYGGDNDPTHTRFDPSTKDGMLLFFRGRAKNFKQCTGENIFVNVKECMYLYSQGIRTFMTDWYKDEPRFFLNKDVMLPEFAKYGGVGGEARAENIRLRSYFCLAAGGNGWDQRFFDAIHRGCVPLMTQLNTSHPYDFLLDYDKFTVFIPNGSQDLKRVPEILDQTVQSGMHANMVRNLRVVHEAFAWSGGSFRDSLPEKDTFLVFNGAYHHAVWAIANRLGKKIPSSSAVQLCKLYFHNPYHANAFDILYKEVSEKLKERCFSDEILSISKSTM